VKNAGYKEDAMYNQTENKKQNSQRLLQGLTLLLNIAALTATALIGWSVYTLIKQFSELYNLMNSSIFF
jgi:hypothetical protein